MKWRETQALLDRYRAVKNDPEKAATIAILDQVFPDIRCFHHSLYGLVVFYTVGKMKTIPVSLQNNAHYILKIEPSGDLAFEKRSFDAQAPREAALGPWDLAQAVGFNGKVPNLSRTSRLSLLGTDWI